MIVELKKLSSNENALRTNKVTGVMLDEPVEGDTFTVLAKPLEDGTVRLVQTSMVLTVVPVSDGWVLQTVNSLYKVKLLGGPNESDSNGN